MPKKQVNVREHERHKPESPELTHVEHYVRQQDIHEGPPPGASELGPVDIDKEVEEIEAIEKELGRDARTCENCGLVDESRNMVRLPSGTWLCKSCNEGKFSRSGEDYQCERVEEQTLWLLGLDDYTKFDEVPAKILGLVKCPHCGERNFTLYAATEDLCMGGVNFETKEIEGEDWSPEESSHYLCCASCHENVTNDDVLASTVKDAVRRETDAQAQDLMHKHGLSRAEAEKYLKDKAGGRYD